MNDKVDGGKHRWGSQGRGFVEWRSVEPEDAWPSMLPVLGKKKPHV